MKTAFVSLATLALFVASAVAQIQINTPTNVVVCQPVQFTWSGGTAPYFLSILPGNDPSAAALQDLGTQNGNSFTWLANIAAGTSIGLTLRDSTGLTAQSAPFTINPGSSTDCVGKTSSASSATDTTSAATTSGTASGTTTSAASTPTTTATGTTPATTSKPTTTSPATSSGTKASTTGSSTTSATSSPNAGPTQAASFGVAGMVGAAVIALLA